MTEKTITSKVQFEMGGSPLAMIVQVASRYESSIHFRQGTTRVNAKSIMGMMTMNFEEGEVITVEADGKDEERAAAGIAAYLAGE